MMTCTKPSQDKRGISYALSVQSLFVLSSSLIFSGSSYGPIGNIYFDKDFKLQTTLSPILPHLVHLTVLERGRVYYPYLTTKGAGSDLSKVTESITNTAGTYCHILSTFTLA